MTGGLSPYLIEKLLRYAFQEGPWTPPTDLYVALHTANPLVTPASEPADSAYARMPIQFNWDTMLTNGTLVTYPEPSESWGQMDYWAIWDDPDTGEGNLLAAGQLTNGRLVIAGDTIKHPINALTINVIAS